VSTTETTAIELAVAQNPAIVLMDKAKRNALYEHIRHEVETFVPDLTTEAGRKAVASLAYKVARTKTAIDEAGKELNDKYRAKINIVDAGRREIREELDRLKERARKPLTDWEESEAKRKQYCNDSIVWFTKSAFLNSQATSEFAQKTLEAVESRIVSTDVFQEFYGVADQARKSAISSLTAAVSRLKQQEADAIELARLREERAQREAREAEIKRREDEARAAEEAAQQKRIREEQRLAEEKAKEERIRQAAEDRARKESEEKARKEQELIAREHQAELDKARREKEEAEARERAAAKQLADEKLAAELKAAQEKAEADKKAAEQKKLEANKKHRTAVMTAAKVALMEHAILDEETAQRVVRAIVAAKIPAVELRFV
jgi:colicin import membrane protein